MYTHNGSEIRSFLITHPMNLRSQGYLLPLLVSHSLVLRTQAAMPAMPVLGLDLCLPCWLQCRRAFPPVAPLRLIAPILLTILLPTASTAPLGLVSVGPSGAVSCTRNSLMPVPFQIPTVPLDTCISLVKMNPHNKLSYQPSARGDHSNEYTRTGEGSTATSCTSRIWRSVAGRAHPPQRLDEEQEP